MRSRAFNVVAEFEAALCEYTGAPYAVTVDSCTNAIFLSLCCFDGSTVEIPKHTYVGVVQAAWNAGYMVEFTDEEWSGYYLMEPTPVVDAAKMFERNMFRPFFNEALVCVSFQAGKHLPIGRGGAILTGDKLAADWLRKARLDGRAPGQDYADAKFQKWGYHMYLDPPSAARGLWLMTYIEDNDKCDWTEYPDLSEATWN